MIKSWKLYILTVVLVILGIGGLYFIGGDLFFESFESVEVLDILTRPGLVQGRALEKSAPEFELPYALTSRPGIYRFQDRTLPTVLVFWATWHQGAVDQLKILSEGRPGLPREAGPPDDRIFEIVVVSLQENKKMVEDFLRQGSTLMDEGRTFTVVVDETGRVGELYDIRSLPTTFFIDAKGIIQDVFVGVLNKEMLEEKINKLIIKE